GLDQRALVHEDLLDPQRFARGDVDQLGLDAAVPRGDAHGQPLQRLPIHEAAKSDRRGSAERNNPFNSWLRSGIRHVFAPSASPGVEGSLWFLACWVRTGCRPSWSVPSSLFAWTSGRTAAPCSTPSLRPTPC